MARPKAKFIGASTAPRPTGDLYPTPPGVTIALMDRMDHLIPQKIWEPACGLGHISKVLKTRYDRDVVSTDFFDWGYGDQVGVDFYNQQQAPNGRFVVTNPPFVIDHPTQGKLTIDDWIAHTLTLENYSGMALLLRTVALAGKTRTLLHKKAGLTWLLQFDGRVTFVGHGRDDIKPANMIDFAWFIYLPQVVTEYPQIDWITEADTAQLSLF